MALDEKHDSAVVPDVARSHAWDYFELHSNQRMANVNYYLVVASILTAGMIAAFSVDVEMPLVASLSGAVLVAASTLFWRLDCRSRELIKASEEALISWERSALGGQVLGQLFSQSRRNDRERPKTLMPVSYYECFRALFAVFGFLGGVGFIVGVGRWVASLY